MIKIKRVYKKESTRTSCVILLEYQGDNFDWFFRKALRNADLYFQVINLEDLLFEIEFTEFFNVKLRMDFNTKQLIKIGVLENNEKDEVFGEFTFRQICIDNYSIVFSGVYEHTEFNFNYVPDNFDYGFENRIFFDLCIDFKAIKFRNAFIKSLNALYETLPELELITQDNR
jgi:hypothetical protein